MMKLTMKTMKPDTRLVLSGLLAVTCVAMLTGASAQTTDWQPVPGPFGMTRWANDVSPDNALPEYPRPVHCDQANGGQDVNVGIFAETAVAK